MAKFYPPASGGIETHLETLSRSLAVAGYPVTVVCVNHLDPRQRDVTWNVQQSTRTTQECLHQVDVIRVGRWCSFARFEICPQLLTTLRKLHLSKKDILHLHTPNPTMLLALNAIHCKASLVITHHSDVIRQKWLRKLQAPFEHRIYEQAKKIIIASPRHADGSKSLKPYADKLTVIPFGIDLQPFITLTEIESNLKDDIQQKYPGPIWLMVGRLVYYKGISVAIQALPHVPGNLLIIGQGPLNSSLQQQAIQCGVQDRVHFLGEVDSTVLRACYHAATAFWFPSIARSEAFGIVQIEALASGLPIINTEIPGSGVPWVSPHNLTGLTIPMQDADALAAAANRLLTETHLHSRFKHAASERAQQMFSTAQMTERMLQTYHSIQ